MNGIATRSGATLGAILFGLCLCFMPLAASAATVEERAVHFAPVLYQDTADGFPNDWHNRRYDLLTRYDFDGDLHGADNWANAESYKLPAFVYYEALETETHVYLFYGMYHPRDWEATGCFHPLCHENDQENYRITVLKDGSEFGTAILVDGDAHGALNSWALSPTVTAGRATLRTAPVPDQAGGSHVRISVEAKGHGPYVCGDDTACRATLVGDGVLYTVTDDGGPSGIVEVNVEPAGTIDARYGLLPTWELLWPRAAIDVEDSFDTNGAVVYTGGRGYTFPYPVASEWNSDEFGSGGDGHVTWGVTFVSGGADRLMDWTFDPALSVFEHYTFPNETDPLSFSMTYTCHPYFGIFDSCPEREPTVIPGGNHVPPGSEAFEPVPFGTDPVEAGYPGCGCTTVPASPSWIAACFAALALAFARRRAR